MLGDNTTDDAYEAVRTQNNVRSVPDDLLDLLRVLKGEVVADNEGGGRGDNVGCKVRLYPREETLGAVQGVDKAATSVRIQLEEVLCGVGSGTIDKNHRERCDCVSGAMS